MMTTTNSSPSSWTRARNLNQPLNEILDGDDGFSMTSSPFFPRKCKFSNFLRGKALPCACGFASVRKPAILATRISDATWKDFSSPLIRYFTRRLNIAYLASLVYIIVVHLPDWMFDYDDFDYVDLLWYDLYLLGCFVAYISIICTCGSLGSDTATHGFIRQVCDDFRPQFEAQGFALYFVVEKSPACCGLCTGTESYILFRDTAAFQQEGGGNPPHAPHHHHYRYEQQQQQEQTPQPQEVPVQSQQKEEAKTSDSPISVMV